MLVVLVEDSLAWAPTRGCRCRCSGGGSASGGSVGLLYVQFHVIRLLPHIIADYALIDGRMAHSQLRDPQLIYINA